MRWCQAVGQGLRRRRVRRARRALHPFVRWVAVRCARQRAPRKGHPPAGEKQVSGLLLKQTLRQLCRRTSLSPMRKYDSQEDATSDASYAKKAASHLAVPRRLPKHR